MCIAAEVKSSKLLVMQTELAPYLFPFKVHHFKVITPKYNSFDVARAEPSSLAALEAYLNR